MEVTIRNLSLLIFAIYVISVKANDDKKDSGIT